MAESQQEPSPRGSEKYLRKRFLNEPLEIYSANGVTSLDDPTYLGFNIIFDRMSPLFSKETTSLGESALSYLKQTDLSRAQYLEQFIDGWLEIADNRSYYYQEVEGLDEVWSNNIGGGDPFKGSARDAGIIVKCLEAIDLKMTAMMSFYRNACYDARYRRIVLPENLRHFNCLIQVVEVRKFRKVMRHLGGKVQYKDSRFPGEADLDAFVNSKNPFAPSTGEQAASELKDSVLGFVNDNISIVSFQLSDCEFHANSGKELFAGGVIANNGANTMAATSFGFSYGNMLEKNDFSGTELVGDQEKKTVTDSMLTRGLNALGNGEIPQDMINEVKDKAKGYAAAQVEGAADSLINRARSIAQGLKLGNVYGLRNEIKAAITNPQALTNIAVGGAVAASDQFGGTVDANVKELGDNLFPRSNQSDIGDLGDAFDQAPPGPSGLDGNDNIFE